VGRASTRSPDLARRLNEIERGDFAAELARLKRLDRAELEAAYRAREIKI
jgi:hypothetical protein